jgi:hypothetical protein
VSTFAARRRLSLMVVLLSSAALPVLAGTSQTISFDTIPNQIMGISPFPITARATSGLSISFTSNIPAVCKTAEDLVILVSVGTCSITASQGGNATYNAAPSVTKTFTVVGATAAESLVAAAGSPFATGTAPRSVAVGDFNGDGIPDLAMPNFGGNNVTVLLGNGSGGFSPAANSPFAVGTGPQFVAVGDFNGDGFLDLAVANETSNNVTILLGNGAGSFTASPGSPFGTGAQPHCVVVGDFNGDGIEDIATANYGGNNLTVMLGNGSGGFTATAGSPFAAGGAPYAIVVGDFNGDGMQDLAAANLNDSDVTVLLGNGAGSFTAASGSPFAVGQNPEALVVGDFNRDGIEDLATADFSSNDVTVLIGNGSGAFNAGTFFPTGTNANSIAVGDYSGDGIQDLAVANYGANNVTVLLGNGSGGFAATAASPFPVGSKPVFIATADFNGDGVEDIATANNIGYSASVLLGFRTGSATQTITFGTLSNMNTSAAPFGISASATSGLAVSFASETNSICTVSGSTVSILSVGTCSIVASQQGSATFAPAPSVTQSFTVSAACSFSLDQGSYTVGSAGGTVSAVLTTQSGCTWTVTNNNPSAITITSGASGTGSGTITMNVAANLSAGSQSFYLPVGTTQITIGQTGAALQLLTVTPCRIIDTRNPNGPFGGPYIAGGTSRSIAIPSSNCGIPATAVAYSLNITVVPRTGTLGYLTVWPAGQAQPVVSTLNSPNGLVLANAAIVPAGTSGAISAFATNDTDLVVDINGYFVPPASNTLQFYPLTPCRVLDTRSPGGTFGGPSIAGGTSRSFPIPSSSCGAPSNAAAYSFNVTVVPQGELGYITAWPTGQAQPLASTLNSLNGAVLANAAIVPAGSGGAASFFATNTTDLVVDINGYFAAPGSGLSFYTATPCRLVDTRNAAGPLGGPSVSGETTRTFPLSSGSCGVPGYPTAQAYSLNMTVVPQGELGYLTTWPAGATQPVVSTLNAYQGQVVANAAVVPTNNGSINVFATNPTDVIVDTNGFFGP